MYEYFSSISVARVFWRNITTEEHSTYFPCLFPKVLYIDTKTHISDKGIFCGLHQDEYSNLVTTQYY